MISLPNPTRLAKMRGPRAWAAIFFGESGLELTIARPAGDQLNVLRQSSASLASSEEATDEKSPWQSAARALSQQVDPREHRVVTAVGCEHVFCQTLRLPTTDPAELKQMLDLQMDTLAPLPLEEVVYSFEPLDQADGQTRVLVAIARKDDVNQRVEVLETAGLPPEIVTVDALAVFREMIKRDLLPRDDKLNGLVLFSPAATNVIVHSRGVIIAVRSIVLSPDALSSPEGQTILREELQQTLAAAGSERPHEQVGRLTLMSWTKGLRPVAEQVAGAWNAQADLLTDGALPAPALSLCLESAAEQATKLNLLPDEWRQKRRAASRRRTLIRCAIGAATVYVVVLAIFLAFLGVRKAQLGKLQKEIRDHQAQFVSARRAHSELLAMQSQLDIRYSALEVLRQVSLSMPDNLKLNSFAYKKEQGVALKGQTQAAQTTYDFIGSLQEAGMFSKVEPDNVRTEPGTGLTRFGVTCTLKTTPGGSRTE